MMKKKREAINICFTIAILIVIALTAYFAFIHKGDEPDNPMNKELSKTNRVFEYENYGLGLTENAMSGIENHSDNEKISDNFNNMNDSHTENNSNGKNYSSTESSDSNRTNDNGNHTDGNPAKVRSGIKGNQTSSEKTDIIYFTTSIIDGETVSKYEYSFTITHLREELEVENVSVYVGGKMVAGFSGNVLLAEGSNTIEIIVTYRTEDEREFRAAKSYTVIVDTKNLWITTNLKNQVVNNPFLEFIAYSQMGEKQAVLTVTCNDETLKGQDAQYSATLKSGNNIITLKAECEGYSVIKTYKITFQPKKEYSIYTTLKNQTIHTDNITFKALILNGTPKAKLSVIVNGEIISGEKELYRADLKIGNNTIRLKATDTNAVSINETYTVKYVPLATEETEPRLTYINVTDGMEINGESFTLNIGAEDYKGNRIYYDGIQVQMNGKKIQYRWSSRYTSYLLDLQNGSNLLEIRLTDSEGRYKDFSYHFKCTYIDEGTPIGSVTVSMDAKVLNIGILMKPKTVDIYYGDNAAQVLERALENSGYTFSYTGTMDKGFYLETISRPGMLRGWRIDEALRQEIIEDGLQFNIIPETGEYVYDMDSLGQLDFCQGSGWTYSVNGEYKELGMSEYIPKDGDEISVRYTLAYGKDIGAYSSYSGTYGIKDKYDNTY